MEKDPVYDAVVAQGTFLERFQKAIMLLPDTMRAVQTQAVGLTQLFERVAVIERALRIQRAQPRQLQSGRPQQAKVTRFVPQPPPQIDEEEGEYEEENELDA